MNDNIKIILRKNMLYQHETCYSFRFIVDLIINTIATPYNNNENFVNNIGNIYLNSKKKKN